MGNVCNVGSETIMWGYQSVIDCMYVKGRVYARINSVVLRLDLKRFKNIL